MSPLWSNTYVNATAPDAPSLFNGFTDCGESFCWSMMDAHFRAYRSEPPPTAVLMTNSTGLVGCTTVEADAAEPLGLGAVPVLLAQAPRVMSAATRISTEERFIWLAPPRLTTAAGV